MKIRKVELEAVAAKPIQYPEEGLTEIALAGRSNVGKSSLINALINRNNFARTSGQPGKTQTINFYNINGDFRIVDLPGYGYAKVSVTERQRWAEMIEKYLTSRESLKEVVLLLDIRHEPGEHDKMMYDWIKSFGYKGYIIATKADKISKGQWQKYTNIIKKKLGVTNNDLIIPFSAAKKLNVEKVWETVGSILELQDEHADLDRIKPEEE
ncbi:ribosome biogenesis GTP-binding protein YihA/YsxC [Proteiniborus sp. MB09-C3]|uniref:ribosome biogenesis GTP-binding protein YihA/YsxC n=1 Tax=Proteiniborus sp. MB09-C3 TaxID=3050072 RepID=UPI002553E39C|nr:ribosome biogenesis GTP-binding protein YihA/YsxC [Proteiniborus sp. MB09-C3]WIV11845.1 ribosome biogenesis GTP-binding protein YihA/YsxC [Proteiniborus sp. MB09-C3]